jgi:tight adherence protein C
MDPLVWLLLGVIALLASGSAMLFFTAARASANSREQADRFERIVRGQRLGVVRARRDLRSSLIAFGGRRVDAAAGDHEVAGLLAKAGFRGHDALAMFTALRMLCPVVVTAVCATTWLLLARGSVGIGLMLVCYAAFTVSYLAPKMLLRSFAEGRARRLRDDVSAFTHLLRVLYECGLSTEQALHVFAKEQGGVLPDIAMEIGEVTRRVGAGSDLGEATRTVAAEAGDTDLTDLFAMIRQIDRYGGAVQEPLMRFASLLEDRERTRLQEKIGKLSAKLTIAMVLFLLPALLTFVGGPGFVAVIRALRQMNV